jgi:hypothetical protein
MASLSTIAPAYGDDYRGGTRSSLSIVRPGHSGHHHHAPTVIDETVVEHEHHHLHHHIDHGDVNNRLAMTRVSVEQPRSSRPGLNREYSYDDLDLRERRYASGATVTTVSQAHDAGRARRHRHRHRSRRGSQERTRYSRSEIDLGGDGGGYLDDNLTVIDVPSGTKRVYVNVDKNNSRQDYHGRDSDVDWRRERGVRRSRGLGNELWTEITKDLVTREAIEDIGYPFEETEFFYYIFEYLDKHQIAELRELTDDIRRERVREIEYQSIAGGGSQRSFDRLDRGRGIEDDSRTEIVIESGGHHDQGRHRRRYYN